MSMSIATQKAPIADLTAQRAKKVLADTQRSADDNKIKKAARDFEAILLGQWLQQAEQTFATVPGSDDESADDPGKTQFQGLATQALAAVMSSNGSFGIARMIEQSLKKHSVTSEQELDPTLQPQSASGGPKISIK